MKYKFIGWCSDGGSDKVWSLLQLEGDDRHGKYVAVYGKRGKTLKTKVHDNTSMYEMRKLVRTKENRSKKPYVSIEESELNNVYPEFEEDLEKTAFWTIMSAEY